MNGKKLSQSLLMERLLSMNASLRLSNCSFSYSSRAKALTTRLPAIFSCAAVFISLRRSRMAMNRGRTWDEYSLVISISIGVTITSSSVSFQLTQNR